jgi:hypothetical protein
MQPRSSIDKANVEREKELSNEIDNLTKKVRWPSSASSLSVIDLC